MTDPTEPTAFACQNCGKRGARDAFAPARDLHERISPGEIYTDLECPECGALATPEPTDPRRVVQLVLHGGGYRVVPSAGRASAHGVPLRLTRREVDALQRCLELTRAQVERDAEANARQRVSRRYGVPVR